MGIVYVLSNVAMPGLVKIGMSDENDANVRIGQLYSTGVPLPFEIEYACRVSNALEVESALHVAFGPQRINPKREFFRINPDQAIAILRLLNIPDATAEIASQPTEIDQISLAAMTQEKARRPNFNFAEMGIPINSILTLISNPGVTVTVVGEKKVRLDDEELFLSAATQKILGYSSPVRPINFWEYNGKSLIEYYEETYCTND